MNKILISIISILMMGCNGQKSKNGSKHINKIIVMKKFDIENFRKSEKLHEKEKEGEIIKGDSIFKYREYDDTFYEEAKKDSENFKKVSNYYKSNLVIKNSGNYFYDMPFGIAQFYNEKGVVVKEINYDENFPFSVYDLIDKIKTTYQIDLKNTTIVNNVKRTFDKPLNRYIYMITYKNEENEKSKYIAVDGQTGEIVSEGILKIKMR